MAEIRIGDFSEGFTLYFETPEERINAYALASALVALADAAKAANRRLNTSGIDIEIVVEALASGSFRAKIAAILREFGLFPTQAVGTLILGVLSTYIYEHTLAKNDSQVVVQVLTDEVIVTQGDNRIVVPRNVHEATQTVAADPTFTSAIDKMLSSITIDPRITGFGLSTQVDGPPPTMILSRAVLEIRDAPTDEESKTRTIEEDCDLQIVKAILEKSTRKWEFRWRGITISAPISDPNFYTDFSAHSITIAPGDEFQARLAIKQVKDDFSGIFANKSYEVVTVYKHIPKMQQRRLGRELVK
jgi:hypothetical protein